MAPSRRRRSGPSRFQLSTGRIAGALAFVLLAGWLAFAVSVSAIVRAAQPELALAVQPFDARAHAKLAEREFLADETSAAGLARASAAARKALTRDATQVAAWRTLGLVETLSERPRRAAALFGVSAQLSRRDLATQIWLIEAAVARADVAGALRHYDTALRTTPSSYDTLMPLLVAAAGDAAVAPQLGRLLAAAPQWTGNYYYRLSQAPPAAADTTAGMLAVARRGGPFPNSEAVQSLIGSYVDRGDYAPAVRMLAVLTQRPVALPKGVRGGGFEGESAYPPLDWAYSDAAEAGAGARGVDAARGAALVAYTTSIGGTAARQLLMLRPGAHRLTYAVGPTEAPAPDRLSWRVTCAGANGRQLVEDIIAEPTRARRAVRFAVPAGCPAQWLTLDIAADGPELSEAWVDDVAVTPEIG